MFTGLIKQLGILTSKRGHEFRILTPLRAKSVALGDSIAVNGVCLTVVTKKASKGAVELGFQLLDETLDLTTFRELPVRSTVNVEPALKANESLGGHLVQGHVDGVGLVKKVTRSGFDKDIAVSAPKNLVRYIVSKGSITIDGVSLTVTRVKGTTFSVALIPHTLKHTTLDQLKKGDKVNLEVDIIAKYVARYK